MRHCAFKRAQACAAVSHENVTCSSVRTETRLLGLGIGRSGSVTSSTVVTSGQKVDALYCIPHFEVKAESKSEIFRLVRFI